jgi:hypothetical protein
MLQITVFPHLGLAILNFVTWCTETWDETVFQGFQGGFTQPIRDVRTMCQPCAIYRKNGYFTQESTWMAHGWQIDQALKS